MKERGNPTLHLFDRYFGIPAIAILGAARVKRQAPSTIKSIGLLKIGAIGDTVLISAVIADLRSAFPEASIIFFAGRSNLELVRMLDGIDHIVEVPTQNLRAGIKAIRSAAVVDVLLDFGQWSRLEALYSRLSRARFTIGFRSRGQYRHFGFDRSIAHSTEVHELENLRALVRCLGADACNPPLIRAPQHIGQPAQPYLVFHLWPGGRRRKLKEWPIEKWLRLMEAFAGSKLNVVLTGAPVDQTRNEELIARTPPLSQKFITNVAGCSLEQTAAFLASAKLVVSVDTGVMHMAAALGAPLVALHGPTASKRWGPIGPKVTVVETTTPGCGYINLGWESPARPPACMDGVRYEDVYEACRSQLEQPNPVTEKLADFGYATVPGGRNA
jgi:ADP-heptose:LPS heptosyltransferase